MASRQTNRKTETTPGQGGGLGAPGTTGAAVAHDPLGAPGSTGASRTNMGAPGYDPTGYHPGGGEQQQLHRSSAGVDTDQGYTFGIAGSMGPTTGGYHAGAYVPVTTTGVSGTYGTSSATVYHDTTTGVGGGGGYDTGRVTGERKHAVEGERGERIEMNDTSDRGGYEFEEMAGDRARGAEAGNIGGYSTVGRKEREGQRRD